MSSASRTRKSRRTRSALAYRPIRGPLQAAGAAPGIVFLGSLCVVAFSFESPLVVGAAGAAVVVAGLAARAGPGLGAALRFGLPLALLITAINPIVTNRGETVLIRGGEVPWLGAVDITLEALVAGLVLGLRILVVTLAFGVYSACVDPDRVLRLVRPLARRSALTASLIARMVPLAAADSVSLSEAASLRGPGAAPVGRAALLRRVVAGSLDRAVDVAATLTLRGYELDAPRPARAPSLPRRSPSERWFLCVGLLIAGCAIAARAAGVGGFQTYPELALDAGPWTILVAAGLPLAAWLPFRPWRGRATPLRRARTPPRPPSTRPADG
jgi:energy-coupling factor transport system permease protein